jgi:hypothetical protein
VFIAAEGLESLYLVANPSEADTNQDKEVYYQAVGV